MAIGTEIPAATIALAASGDEVAFARIVAAHHADMARVCFVISGDADLAQEGVQAAWLIAWRRMRSLRDPSSLRPWLMAVAANEVRQLIRRRRRRGVIEIAVDDRVTYSIDRSDPAGRTAELDLADALGRLSVEDRSLVAMRFGVGLTSVEIGRAIGMSSGGVRARLGRLLERLREDLGDV